jgi:AP2-associated kinase
MCDTFSNYKVNEKVDIWMLGCILYTLIYKKHPFFEAQKLTIINTQYFTPDTTYSEKIIDFVRLMMTPNPDKRPDIKKVIQIIQNWDTINKIELPVINYFIFIIRKKYLN